MTDDGRFCTVYPGRVKNEGGIGYLNDQTDFPDTEKIEIWLLHRFFPFLDRRIDLTLPVEEAMRAFLHSYHTKKDMAFDCYRFACLVGGMPDAPRERFNEVWERVRRYSPRIGDVVFLLWKQHFRHAAIYLGRGLYISVWGAGGDLEFASLKDMGKSFRADRAILVAPRTKAAA